MGARVGPVERDAESAARCRAPAVDDGRLPGDSGLEAGVTAIRQQGSDTYSITGTPTFIVNGNKVVGNVPLPAITSYFK